MGKPSKIADLAHQMIQLSGLVPGKDIQIVYTGLRPGEKLYEELLSEKENTLPTYHPKIKIAKVAKYDYTGLTLRIESLLKRIYSLSKQEVIDFLREIIPEYRSSNGLYNGKPFKKELIEVDSKKK
jgi:FlaA1/EpsC-like NDP-sugar epimerase